MLYLGNIFIDILIFFFLLAALFQVIYKLAADKRLLTKSQRY